MSSGKRDFDKEAATWDEEPRRVKLAKELFEAIRDQVPLKPSMAALDFGCGTGLVTLQLSPCVGQVTGVDSSQGMLEVIERKARSSQLTNVTTHRIDLESGDALDGSYDLVVSTMTLHHVRDITSLLAQFARVIKPQGHICLADLDSENGEFHGNNEGVFHNGFDRDQLKTALSDAGFSGLTDRTAAEIIKPAADGKLKSFSVFLIAGRLAESTK